MILRVVGIFVTRLKKYNRSKWGIIFPKFSGWTLLKKIVELPPPIETLQTPLHEFCPTKTSLKTYLTDTSEPQKIIWVLVSFMLAKKVKKIILINFFSQMVGEIHGDESHLKKKKKTNPSLPKNPNPSLEWYLKDPIPSSGYLKITPGFLGTSKQISNKTTIKLSTLYPAFRLQPIIKPPNRTNF